MIELHFYYDVRCLEVVCFSCRRVEDAYSLFQAAFTSCFIAGDVSNIIRHV
jgi:hypothetical protein